MKFKGTKGEWSYKADSGKGLKQGYSIIANEEFGWGDWVASVLHPGLMKIKKREAEANAKLISAAPELLEALQKLNKLYPGTSKEVGAEKAINKALGN